MDFCSGDESIQFVGTLQVLKSYSQYITNIDSRAVPFARRVYCLMSNRKDA